MKKTKNIGFETDRYADKDSYDLVSLWCHRIVLNTRAKYIFYQERYGRFDNDQLAYFLGLGRFVDNDELDRSSISSVLKENLNILENKRSFGINPILKTNIETLQKALNLTSYECEILIFLIYLHTSEILWEAAELLGRNLNSSEVFSLISTVTKVPINRVKDAFSNRSALVKSSIISMSRYETNSIQGRVEFITNTFGDSMITAKDAVEALVKSIVTKCDSGTLLKSDYQHIEKDLKSLLIYLKSIKKTSEKGVNILLYGEAGTGKTELAKLLAREIGSNLYEVNYADENGDVVDSKTRLGYFRSAQSLIGSKGDTLLMYDEAEDIFDSGMTIFGKKKQANKAWINRSLEENKIPTIWISNDIDSIDNAIVRRFDIALELPIPTQKDRERIIKKHIGDELDSGVIEELAKHENLAPALISRAIKVANKINPKDKTNEIKRLLNNTLKAQGYKELAKSGTDQSLQNYTLEYINTTTDLNELISGIDETSSARICIYGVAGTGKSAFGKHIAEKLGKPLIIKKASDLLSKWVGENEQNIAKAFEEATKSDAVLVFDEVDSFLADRTRAIASWEATLVNEMLVQMESFEGIFIATTNLIDTLDQASLRRFDLKLKFDYLLPNQAMSLFAKECKTLAIKCDQSQAKRASFLGAITVGDFAAVRRQNRFRKIKDADDFLARLRDEVEIKNTESLSRLGFVG